ncbi:MAG: hypothetical protein ACI9LO_001440 [Planctomycetota bacterium]|jgi:hypothetical protein
MSKTYGDIQQTAWRWLGRELDRWADTDQVVELWWRDDDAVADNALLQRLLGISETYQLPVSLAVIPAALAPGLNPALRLHEQVSVLQHGYAHENYAPGGEKKLELGGDRSIANLKRDLSKGFERLQGEFDSQFTPVLVPPWNRITPPLIESLGEIGFRGISTMKARAKANPAPELLMVNTHLDPVNWRHRGGFIGDYLAIAILIQHLQGKRTGYRDAGEPSGILTHHLVQNEAVWDFFERLIDFLSRHEAVNWVSAKTIWK